MKELSHELWRPLSRMRLVPVACDDQKVRADQLQVAVGHRLVDHDLGACGVDYAGGHEVQVHKMKAHCSRVRSADTAEQEGIAIRFGHGNVLVLRGIFS